MYIVKIRIINNCRAVKKSKDYYFTNKKKARKFFNQNKRAIALISRGCGRIFQVALIDRRDDSFITLTEINQGRSSALL